MHRFACRPKLGVNISAQYTIISSVSSGVLRCFHAKLFLVFEAPSIPHGHDTGASSTAYLSFVYVIRQRKIGILTSVFTCFSNKSIWTQASKTISSIVETRSTVFALVVGTERKFCKHELCRQNGYNLYIQQSLPYYNSGAIYRVCTSRSLCKVKNSRC